MTLTPSLPAYDFTAACVAEADRDATKTITRQADGSLLKRPYSRTSYWRYIPSHASSHREMAEVLRVLAPASDVMIMMGEVAPGVAMREVAPGVAISQPQRRLWAAEPEQNTLIPVDRAWLPVDLDDVEVPTPFEKGDRLDEAAAHVRDHLMPEEFRGVECVVAATSSTGLCGTRMARMRLFFLLDQTWPLATMKEWARRLRLSLAVPIDDAVIQAGQPIYTARPIFRRMDDPVPKHLWAFVLPGSRGERVPLRIVEPVVEVAAPLRVVEPVIKVVASPAAIISFSSSTAAPFGAPGNRGEWRDVLESTLGGPMGFFKPLVSAIGLAAAAGADEGEVVDFARRLLFERADADRIAHYDDFWIRAAFRNFRRADARTDQRIARARARLFSGVS